MSESASRAWLGPFLASLRPVFMEILAMSAFVNLLALAVPVFTMQVYDRVVGKGGISTLEGLLLGMIIVLIFDYILRQARSRITQRVALRVDVIIGRQLFNKVMALPLQALEAQPAAYWTSLFRDVDTIRNTLSGASAILIVDLPFAFFFLGLIFVIALPVAWVLLIIIPGFMYIAWRSANVMAAASADERQSSQTRDSLVNEIIAGRTTIKALALDNAMRPMWESAHAENIERALYRGSRTDGYSNFGMTLSLVTTLLITTIGALAIIDQKLTMGALIATNMLSGRIMGPLNQLVSQWRTYTGFKQSVDKLGTMFNTASEREESSIKLERPNGEIEIETVMFAYAPGGKPVINDITLTIKAGGVHALVGRNGSGKSTLLKIIQGLYQPSKGRVLLDGADISQFTRTELAGWMGYVPQDSILFTGTIRDNIVLRRPDASDDEVLKAAQEAGVHQFVIDLPDGYATDIGESGANLSGGQRQRIAIARALVGDPPVLILDEPSSSLDRQAEQELRRTLVEIGRDRTVLIVTHSPILLAACNDLVALDRGKVALAGPAQDILPKLFGTAAPRRPEGEQAAKPGAPGGPKPMPPGGTTPANAGGPAAPKPQSAPTQISEQKSTPKPAPKPIPPGGPRAIPPGGPQKVGPQKVGPQKRPAPAGPGGTPQPAMATRSAAPRAAGAKPGPQAPGKPPAATPNTQTPNGAKPAAQVRPAPPPQRPPAANAPAAQVNPNANTRSGK